MSGNIFKTQFNVEMHCESCALTVEEALRKLPGVTQIDIDLTNQEVVVEGTAMFIDMIAAVEQTGKKVTISGQGVGLGAAVAVLDESLHSQVVTGSATKGHIRFVQISKEKVLIEGVISSASGLAPGLHGLYITEFGDFSEGCSSSGNHFNPHHKKHGGPLDEERHVGDLGNISINENGEGRFRIIDTHVKVWDIIGRGVVITEREDDLGQGSHPDSKINGHSGRGVLGGVIARSAGIGENRKKICTCDEPTF